MESEIAVSHTSLLCRLGTPVLVLYYIYTYRDLGLRQLLFTGKKSRFFKVFKSSWYNIYNYGIKEKRSKKEVTTTMVDFNNKFLND